MIAAGSELVHKNVCEITYKKLNESQNEDDGLNRAHNLILEVLRHFLPGFYYFKRIITHLETSVCVGLPLFDALGKFSF